jgi:hypothetical protein
VTWICPFSTGNDAYAIKRPRGRDAGTSPAAAVVVGGGVAVVVVVVVGGVSVPGGLVVVVVSPPPLQPAASSAPHTRVVAIDRAFEREVVVMRTRIPTADRARKVSTSRAGA